MTIATLRSSYSISAPTLKRFNAAVPQGERSRVIEKLMLQALDERESELAKIAEAYMTDPAFSQCREDEAVWDATVGDGLEGV